MKKFTSYTLIFMILFSFSIAGMADVVRNETVYVSLKHNGEAENIKIVTHISGSSNDDYYVEYGQLDNLQVLTKDVEPTVEKGTIKWDAKKLKEKDIYYEGKISKKLPLDLKIRYYLDGTEVEAQDLAGKSGKVEISIKVENSEDLTTQIQLPLNLDVFKNIESKKGVMSVVGKTMTVVFTHLPMGDEEFTVKAEGQDIEFDSIIISSMDSSTMLGEGLGELDKLTDGFNEMSDATEKLEEGSKELSKGMGLLKNGLKSLGEGVTKLVDGLKEIGSNLKSILKGFKELNDGLGQLGNGLKEGIESVGDMNQGLNRLSSEGDNIEKGIEGLNGGLMELKAGYNSIGEGLSGLNQGHSDLSLLAQSLVDSNDPRVKGLAEGVIKEGKVMEELGQGMKQINMAMGGVAQNTNQLLEGYKVYNKGINQIAMGFGQFSGEIKALPDEIQKMHQGHSQLVDGLDLLLNGLEQSAAGGAELEKGARNIPGEVDKVIDGQDKITDGLNKLREEGIEEITDNVKKFSNKDESQGYTSFVDERNVDNSNCQILMQTPSIKVEKETSVSVPQGEVKRTFFQRIIDLFKVFRK